MKTYPKYRDSGIQWIGKIPEHWMVVRIKDLGMLGSGTTPKSGNDAYYDGTHPWLNTGCVQNCIINEPAKYVTDLAIHECSGLRYYPKDTILIAMYGGGTIGNVGLMGFDATINQACCAIELSTQHLPKYMFYAIMAQNAKLISNGFGGTQINLSQGQIANFLLAIPPLEEQRAIAAYLDEKCGEIDGQVALLEKKRDAYARLKVSVINKAVTHGLNPDVSMRPSGIDWIGDIPAHWNVKRIKDLGSLGSGTTPKSGSDAYYDDGIHPWLNTGCVQNCIINQPAKYVTELAMKECPGLRYYPKDTILVAMYGGGTIGNVGLMGFDATINQACCAIELSTQHLPKYMFYAIMAQNAKLISYGFGGTQINLSQGQIANFLLAVPPLAEQRAIADYLDKKCGEIDAVVENLDKQINAYKRLKKSLINEVVTGKRAV